MSFLNFYFNLAFNAKKMNRVWVRQNPIRIAWLLSMFPIDIETNFAEKILESIIKQGERGILPLTPSSSTDKTRIMRIGMNIWFEMLKKGKERMSEWLIISLHIARDDSVSPFVSAFLSPLRRFLYDTATCTESLVFPSIIFHFFASISRWKYTCGVTELNSIWGCYSFCVLLVLFIKCQNLFIGCFTLGRALVELKYFSRILQLNNRAC